MAQWPPPRYANGLWALIMTIQIQFFDRFSIPQYQVGTKQSSKTGVGNLRAAGQIRPAKQNPPARDMLVRYEWDTPYSIDCLQYLTISNNLWDSKTVIHLVTAGMPKRFIFKYSTNLM